MGQIHIIFHQSHTKHTCTMNRMYDLFHLISKMSKIVSLLTGFKFIVKKIHNPLPSQIIQKKMRHFFGAILIRSKLCVQFKSKIKLFNFNRKPLNSGPSGLKNDRLFKSPRSKYNTNVDYYQVLTHSLKIVCYLEIIIEK